MSELINTLTADYGGPFTAVIIAFVIIFLIIAALLPFFVWSIHNQTTWATKELKRLNKLIGRLIVKQLPHDRFLEESSKGSPTDERLKEMLKEKRIEPLIQEKLPEQATRRRKVFYKPEDKLPEQKIKTS